MTIIEKGDVGTFRAYSNKSVRAPRMAAIIQAAAICQEYESQGYTLTLRQLYYQHVARGLIPNSDEEYNKLGDIVSDGRLMGIISWTAIEDRGRSLHGLETVGTPEEAIAKTAENFRLDLWRNQHVRPEVWVEKDALAGVVNGICNTLRVDFFPCKGYASLSEMWRAGRRFVSYLGKGQRPVVLYLGDHDPSGIHMTEDVAQRLQMFCGTPIQVIRLALNWNQILEVNPPPNPAKKSDSRFAAYAAVHGEQSWELDALEPAYIQNLINDAVLQLRDEQKWSEALAAEVADKQYLIDLSKQESF